MKVVKLIKDDCITGVEYGVVDVPETESEILAAKSAYHQAQNKRMTRMRKINTKNK